eukprot:TRINITY_DN6827_c0_g1_i1.p1 TRINITY_DN6827_c0_g1~~TRINITY_DN6827_c0_g1_i1.p1  ORF type:complete len:748 (+),score=107.12 TRINITY_DN6827_c0_g1_i1:63-2306(+)
MASLAEVERMMHGRRYEQPKKVADHALALAARYTGHLTIGANEFVHRDGSAQQLLKLEGTVPVPYGGQAYNIPVRIWFPQNYPTSGPMAFVTPTASMLIKPNHRHVDLEGRCYAPYLSNWDKRSSTAMQAVAELVQLFSQDPPVYAKPTPAQPTSGYQQSYYPSAGAVFPGPAAFQQPQPPRYDSSTPVGAAYPSQQGFAQPYPGQAQTQGYPSYSGPGSASAAQRSVSYPVQPVAAASPPAASHGYFGHNPGQPATTGYPPFGQYPNAYQPSQPRQPSPPLPPPVPKEDPALAGMRSIIEEKIRHELQARFETPESTLEYSRVLKSINETSSSERDRLEEQKATLRAQVEKQAEDLEKSLLEISSFPQSEDSVEKLAVPPHIWQLQLLETQAEDAAVEDVIYQLGKTLHQSEVSLDEWLKTVRQLLRKQFHARALHLKVASAVATLPPPVQPSGEAAPPPAQATTPLASPSPPAVAFTPVHSETEEWLIVDNQADAFKYPAGLQTALLPDSSLTASKGRGEDDTAPRARLNITFPKGPSGWAPKTSDSKQFLQINLTRVVLVTGVATQGRADQDHWVTKYRLEYSADGASWTMQEGIFDGNNDRNTVVRHPLRIQNCRYLRFYPVSWHKAIGLRVEVYIANQDVPLPGVQPAAGFTNPFQGAPAFQQSPGPMSPPVGSQPYPPQYAQPMSYGYPSQGYPQGQPPQPQGPMYNTTGYMPYSPQQHPQPQAQPQARANTSAYPAQMRR